MTSDLFEPPSDPDWCVEEPGYCALRELGVESRLTTANGLIGVRGVPALVRAEARNISPRTYIAGMFDTPARPLSTPVGVSLPEGFGVDLLIDGHPLSASEDRILDLKRGVLTSSLRPGSGPLAAMDSVRLASQVRRGLGLQVLRLRFAASAEVILKLPPRAGVRDVEADLLVSRTRPSGRSYAVASAATLTLDGLDHPPEQQEDGSLQWRWTSGAGQVAVFEQWRTVARDDETGAQALSDLSDARNAGVERVVAAHVAAWAALWSDSDITIEGDPDAQKALRFATYHLNSAVNPDDDTVSVGARALTGDGYLGHVFWDTEIFLLPVYSLIRPEAARAMLMYRFHTLAAARAKAARLGWRGALYAWESTDTGDEATPESGVTATGVRVDIPTGRDEQHISADVAYAVWRYWRATGDDVFLRTAGAEILLETARFWASRAILEADGRRHIRKVEGPDEYHEAIDDNAFTNVMAAWNLRRGAEAWTWLQKTAAKDAAALGARLSLTSAEVADWPDIADALVTGRDARAGLVEQFAGFFQLDDLDARTRDHLSGSMGAALGRARLAEVQILKQADVVALIALLPETFTQTEALANFRYYEPRCDNDSSLSPAMHALVAARLGDTEMALAYFREAAMIDLGDRDGRSEAGVHMAAQGGLWQAAVFGFAGLCLKTDQIVFDPHLPAGWTRLAFPLQWRGRKLLIRIESGANDAPSRLTITLISGAAFAVSLRDAPHRVDPGPGGLSLLFTA
ncbi:glycosyl hydrolase family 65 protein [Brevundimonas sp. SL130]|uniref:glycosyl hydrolase family 65 protein n=1 Tax=Brevundimonas sp. SL130 TaxID=2995143 RepID=UPI00226CE11D|nr:glycosyl hydrolase family 65 protein [Brevundimonas sp. SL130]WAC59082.1 hypothetical protein OU998_12775 [Brevundimonas sp. SL130]